MFFISIGLLIEMIGGVAFLKRAGSLSVSGIAKSLGLFVFRGSSEF